MHSHAHVWLLIAAAVLATVFVYGVLSPCVVSWSLPGVLYYADNCSHIPPLVPYLAGFAAAAIGFLVARDKRMLLPIAVVSIAFLPLPRMLELLRTDALDLRGISSIVFATWREYIGLCVVLVVVLMVKRFGVIGPRSLSAAIALTVVCLTVVVGAMVGQPAFVLVLAGVTLTSVAGAYNLLSEGEKNAL